MNRSLRADAWRPTRAELIVAGVVAGVLVLLGGSLIVARVRASGGPDRVLSQGWDVALPVAHVTVAEPHPAPAYDRDCRPGHGCVFGPSKTDRLHAGPGGFNGCDGFNKLARAQMNDVILQADTRGCVVASGILTDPYTGEQIPYMHGSATPVSIDHVRALKSAWDAGAWAWPLQQRIDFAKDQQLNLLLVFQAVNSSKGDRGPGQWMPPNRHYWCDD